jgi:type II secretory pathway pseudopilin PulG
VKKIFRNLYPTLHASRSGSNDASRFTLHASGFTLVELLVVIGITVLLSGFLLAYSGTSRSQVSLSIERAKLTQMILRAKSLAIETYGSAGCCYGVRILDATRYALVSYGVADCSAIISVDPAGTNTMETYTLSSNLSFDNNSVNFLVLFIPPDPRTVIMSGGAVVQEGTVTMRATNGGTASNVVVTVGAAGQVSY